MNQNNLAVENFRKYLQIPSLSLTTDYVDCVEFLRGQAESLGVTFEVIQLLPKRPVVLMKWIGTDPSLPVILLNSHMDVVPAEESKWTYPPFAAHIDEEGRIFARGSQDMKNLGVQYLETIRRLKHNNVQLARTLVLSYVPCEEIGGREGMKLFVETPQFRDLNIAFALDEGAGSGDTKKMILFYGEKHKWSLKFHLTGNEGHGSLNLPNTASEKLSRLLHSIYSFRQTEIDRSTTQYYTDVVSINVTIIEAGQQENVIPSEITVTTDIRLPPYVNLEAWKETVANWCYNAGEGVWAEKLICEVIDIPTDYKNNRFYKKLEETLKKWDIIIDPMISMGISDSRYLRHIGIPSLGFSPLTTPLLAHKHDEYIYKDEFLQGIDIYYQLLIDIGNLI